MTTHRDRTVSFGQGAKFVDALLKAGMIPSYAQAVVQGPRGPEVAKRIIDVLAADSFPYGEHENAHGWVRAKMFNRFHGLFDAYRVFGADYSEEELADLKEIPFFKLEDQRLNRALVAGSKVSLIDIMSMHPELFHKDKDGIVEPSRAFCREEVGAKWFMIGRTALGGSTGEMFSESRKLLTDNLEVPRACEVVYALVVHYFFTKAWPSEDFILFCSDEDFDNNCRIGVGVEEGRISVGLMARAAASTRLGLAYRYKPERKT